MPQQFDVFGQQGKPSLRRIDGDEASVARMSEAKSGIIVSAERRPAFRWAPCGLHATNSRHALTAHFQIAPAWYNSHMTKAQVKTILDRVLTWPPERQQEAAEMLTLMEEQDKTTLRLTDEQVEEVKRRLADPNPKFLTLEEVRERFARRRA